MDEAVKRLLLLGPLSFPALEAALQPYEPLAIRQAAWRLIGRGEARLTKELQVQLT